MTDRNESLARPPDGRALLVAAFEQARLNGKANWFEMTTAVLKNRLLSLTGGKFDERQYGAASIAGFAEMYPDTVVVDRDRPYPLVVLAGHEASAPVPASTSRAAITHLRPDLWSAVFDFSRPEGYVWDGARGLGVVRETGVEGPLLPTLTSAEFDSWREEFAKANETGLDEGMLDQLENWLKHRLPTRFLPSGLQARWNQEMKERAAVRLRAWFASHGIPEPTDLLAPTSLPSPTLASAETQALRQLVQACVARMTADELRALTLPVSAVARIVRTRARTSD